MEAFKIKRLVIFKIMNISSRLKRKGFPGDNKNKKKRKPPEKNKEGGGYGIHVMLRFLFVLPIFSEQHLFLFRLHFQFCILQLSLDGGLEAPQIQFRAMLSIKCKDCPIQHRNSHL